MDEEHADEMFLYAQLGENNTVVGMSQLSGEVDKLNMVRLTQDEFNKIGIGWRWVSSVWLEPLPPEPTPNVPSNIQIAQTMMSISADLDIMNANDSMRAASSDGANSPLYEKWYDAYMTNQAAIITLNRLVTHQVLTQSEVDKMVADRLEQYGY